MTNVKLENVYNASREKEWLKGENQAMFSDIQMLHYKCHTQSCIHTLILYLNVKNNSAKTVATLIILNTMKKDMKHVFDISIKFPLISLTSNISF